VLGCPVGQTVQLCQGISPFLVADQAKSLARLGLEDGDRLQCVVQAADEFHYLDSSGKDFGPFPTELLRVWFIQGLFPSGGELLIRRPNWQVHMPLRVCYPDLQQAFFGPLPEMLSCGS